MLFWIILIVIAALAACAVWYDGDWFLAGLVMFWGSVIGALAVLICAASIPVNVDLVKEKTYTLKALGTTSKTTGQFFLGSGYIDGKRVLNYIKQADGGAITVSQTVADDAAIFEDSENATVTGKHYDYNNGWILPWPIGSTDRYEFHIPAGSVAESYTIDNQ